MKIINVLIVDDSRLIQSILTELFSRDQRFNVVGVAADPHEARTLIKQTDPDVITLDVEMPKMNGIAFLRNIMRLRPTPVVMISTLTAKGAGVTLDALEIGAVDFIQKPDDLAHSLDRYAEVILSTVYQAAQVSRLKLLEIQQRLQQDKSDASSSATPSAGSATSLQPSSVAQVIGYRLCAIGGSTGGLEALTTLLKGTVFNGKETIVVCLHLPAGFTASYAKRLNNALPITVKEAQHNEPLYQGCAYIAPGGLHMEIKPRNDGFAAHIHDKPPVNRHKPSVDVLFDSVAKHAGASAMGIILTGMGSDGANGLLNMAQTGCITYAQDEDTSVVWGMPGSAVRLGAVEKRRILPLRSLSQHLMKYYRTT